MKHFSKKKKKIFVILFILLLSVIAVAVTMTTKMNGSSKGTVEAPEGELSLELDHTKWNYDQENDVYWQIQVYYCTKPVAYDYETMGIYVPGAYFHATDNGDGTYTCVVNEEGSVGGYTAATAPIVFPVNTAGYSAQPAPTSYSYQGLSEYLENGFIYVYAGMRGRDNVWPQWRWCTEFSYGSNRG